MPKAETKLDDITKLSPQTQAVIWTKEGEELGAHSEHGTHKEGDEVQTEHAAVLIERGFAKASA